MPLPARRYSLLIFFLFLLNIICVGQDSTKTPIRANVRAYIQGYPYEDMLEPFVFKVKGKLLASDSSYEIISFRMTWDDESSIHTRAIYGNEIPVIDKEYKAGELKNCCYVTFDHIKAKKKDSIYFIRALAIKLADPETVKSTRKELAHCYIELEGYAGRDVFNPMELRKGFSLVTSDPRYRLLEFELEFEDPDTGDLKVFKINGNKVNGEDPGISKMMKLLQGGSVIIIQNIRIYNNGINYKAKPLALYIK